LLPLRPDPYFSELCEGIWKTLELALTCLCSSAAATTPDYQVGLSLGEAPQTDDDLFVGREAEVAQLKQWLLPTPKNQNVVAVSGLGGMGKSQLSIHFAKQYHESYSAVIWLNAKDANTLKSGYVTLALRFMGREERRIEIKKPDEDEAVQYVQRWLSQPENDQ
jgi:AAA ATPase domain